jgi:DNA-binding NtrC family response regulator
MKLIKKYKIFIVDDDLFCLNMYDQHIKNLGYEDITLFQNGTDCLNNLIEYPNIIFLDHNMDMLSGFEVLKKIKRFDPNVNVVMVSGQDDLQIALNALKYGAFDYIAKGDQENEKIESVIKRIEDLDIEINRSKPSFLKNILSFI